MMQASPLPYEMGNAGDFIKHGLLAEFTEWWLLNNSERFVFVDPFAGRPFVSPIHDEVRIRLQRLHECALTRAQRDSNNAYYGSGEIVKNLVSSAGHKCDIYFSDRDELAYYDLLAKGFQPIDLPGFNRQDSFSIVNSSFSDNSFGGSTASLLLLDPFDDFISEYVATIVPALPEFIIGNNLPVILFVLCEDWKDESGIKWQRLRDQHLGHHLPQLSINCAKQPMSDIKGESKFHSEAVLILPPGWQLVHLYDLVARLQNFVTKMCSIMPQQVNFSAANI